MRRNGLYLTKRICLKTSERQLGAFVTLKVDGALRGCIGRFISTDPLYKVVRESALSSAFEDPQVSASDKGGI